MTARVGQASAKVPSRKAIISGVCRNEPRGKGRAAQVGEADGEGVGLVRSRVVAQTEKGTGHESDLIFFGGALAGGGFFDQLWRIFVDGETPAGGGEEGRSPGGSEDDGGPGVLDVDDEFDGEGLGRMLLD